MNLTYAVNPATGSGQAVPKVGGVLIGITDATTTTTGQPITVGKTSIDLAIKPVVPRPQVKTTSGVYNAISARTSGNFDYSMTDWMVRRIGTTINGVASTALLTTGSDPFKAKTMLRQKALGAGTSLRFRQNNFSWAGISNQRSPWVVAPTGLTYNYVSPADGSSASTDQGIYVTYLAVPGELVYRDGSPTAKLDDYKARTLG